VGRLPELIEDNVNGLLMREVSVEAIVETVSAALQTPDFRQRCGAAGRATVEQKYVFANQVDHLRQIYDRVIEAAGER
jgi:glycosyltransferase involved in cell wall biosynthesis